MSSVALNIYLSKWFKLADFIFYIVIILVPFILGLDEIIKILCWVAIFYAFSFLADFLAWILKPDVNLATCDGQNLNLALEERREFDLKKVEYIEVKSSSLPLVKTKIVVHSDIGEEIIKTSVNYGPLLRFLNRVKPARAPNGPEAKS